MLRGLVDLGLAYQREDFNGKLVRRYYGLTGEGKDLMELMQAVVAEVICTDYGAIEREKVVKGMRKYRARRKSLKAEQPPG
jgi:DNA-binding HxlR family transcriptional regulator